MRRTTPEGHAHAFRTSPWRCPVHWLLTYRPSNGPGQAPDSVSSICHYNAIVYMFYVTILLFMQHVLPPNSHPQLLRTLQRLGERIRLARRRRRLTAALVAQRAGMTPFTLRRIEQGAPGGTVGAYIGVLHVLGLGASIDEVAKTDALGRALQDASLGAPTKPSQNRLGDRLTAIPRPPASVPELYRAVRGGASKQPTKASHRRSKPERLPKGASIHINDLLKLVDRP